MSKPTEIRIRLLDHDGPDNHSTEFIEAERQDGSSIRINEVEDGNYRVLVIRREDFERPAPGIDLLLERQSLLDTLAEQIETSESKTDVQHFGAMLKFSSRMITEQVIPQLQEKANREWTDKGIHIPTAEAIWLYMATFGGLSPEQIAKAVEVVDTPMEVQL